MNKTNEARRHAQRHCFALTSELLPRFTQHGISETDFWTAAKSYFGVSSRADIDEYGYVLLSARLHAAIRHQRLFDALCCEIQERARLALDTL